MAKPSHAKRTRPRPMALKRHHVKLLRADERRSARELDRWRRAS